MIRERRVPSRLFVALALALALASLPASSPVNAATYTFAALADAQVSLSAPNANYGTSTALGVKAVSAGKAFRTFVRFTVVGTGGPVTSATMRLWVSDSSDQGGAVHAVQGTWQEPTISWSNAPQLDVAVVAQIGVVRKGTWASVDLGTAITGDGTYAFAIDGVSVDKATYGSREGSRPPELTVAAVPAPTPTPALTPTPDPTPTPSPSPTPTPTPTLAPDPTPTPAPSPGPTPTPVVPQLVLCDGQTYVGFSATIFRLDGGVYADAGVRKVIRNCSFLHASQDAQPILIQSARNVLIEGNTFDDIHSGQVGNGTMAIVIKGATQADDITIRGNSFANIGADGIQMANGGRLVSNVLVEGNTFTAPTTFVGGENAIDIKGVDGPVIIRANSVSGFRPCDGATMECSGSTGVGITVHEGSGSGRANGVTLESNSFVDNTVGLSVTDADDTSVVGNTFTDNVGNHVWVGAAAAGCTHAGNVFIGTGVVAWGTCVER